MDSGEQQLHRQPPKSNGLSPLLFSILVLLLAVLFTQTTPYKLPNLFSRSHLLQKEPARCVVWMGPFLSGGGYSSEAWSYISALHSYIKKQESPFFKLGIQQHGDGENLEFWEGLPLDMKNLAIELYQTKCRMNESIFICHSEPGAWYPPLFQTFPCPPSGYGKSRAVIGRTMFETDRVNVEHVGRCNRMDFVWVPTDFHVNAFTRSGVDPIKVRKIVQPVDLEFFDPSLVEPLDLNLIATLVLGSDKSNSREPFVFLSVFKWEYRKGWDVLLTAYLKEFSGMNRVSLYLLTNPYHTEGDFANKIVEFVEDSDLVKPVDGWAPVYVINDHIPHIDLPKLYMVADAFVLPSRGEGWGRPIMEAMAMSLPVITTNWSGPTEYLTDENSYPVPISGMSEVREGAFKGHLWAEPSADKLQVVMRHVGSNPSEAKMRGRQARADMMRRVIFGSALPFRPFPFQRYSLPNLGFYETMASAFMRQFEQKRSILKRSGRKYLDEALYKKLFKNGGEDQKVREQLNHFLKTHKSAYKWEVGKSLKHLRTRKLYGPALKLSETMEKRGMNMTVSDQAIHLDLVAKSKGISAAETYFVTLPESSKNHLTYGALLNCYCKNLMTEKAVALFEKMKELNLELTSMPYNSLMTLYLKTGLPKMVPPIIQEMKACDIMPEIYTYNVWMRALAAVDDITGVEKVIDEMKRDGRVVGDWTTYSNLASIYAHAGLFDKASKALRELENKNTRRELSAYQFLITLYGRTGNLCEVYRIWRSLKLAFKKTANISFLNMIQVLVNLNDLPGAEKCFKEWACGCETYDIRIGNVLIGAYLGEGLFEKAEVLMNLARRRGCKPNSKSWELYLEYYLKRGEIKSAVDCVENAISVGKGEVDEWAPSPSIVRELMLHFERNKDVEGAEVFLAVLTKSKDKLQSEVLESLIRIYASSERKDPTMRRRIKMEKVELSEEGMKLLNDISDQ